MNASTCLPLWFKDKWNILSICHHQQGELRKDPVFTSCCFTPESNRLLCLCLINHNVDALSFAQWDDLRLVAIQCFFFCCHAYFQYMMQGCRNETLQAPRDAVFTCSHFHFLSDAPIIALGNVNVSPRLSPWYFLSVYLYASLVRRCAYLSAQGFMCAAFWWLSTWQSAEAECRRRADQITGSETIVLASCPRLTLMAFLETLRTNTGMHYDYVKFSFKKRRTFNAIKEGDNGWMYRLQVL